MLPHVDVYYTLVDNTCNVCVYTQYRTLNVAFPWQLLQHMTPRSGVASTQHQNLNKIN